MDTATDETFEQAVIRSAIPAAVFFESMGCPFCARMAPTMEELAAQYAGKIKIVAMDVSQGANTAVKYGVMGVPQVLIFKAGEKAGEIRGWASKADVVKKLESVLQ